MPKRKKKVRAGNVLEALEVSARLQDIYEYVSNRDLVFVEIPSTQFLVSPMSPEEVKAVQKTGVDKFYRGVHPLVLYVDNSVAVPVNTSLLQPYYDYLRYLVSTQEAVWAYAIPLTSKEVRELYYAVSGEELPESLEETLSQISEGMEAYMDLMEGFEGETEETLRPFLEKRLGSVYSKGLASPALSFFSAYFERYPASTKPEKATDSLYGRIPVLSGHTGIAKSAIVKQLEREYVPVALDRKGRVVSLRPKVITFKTGSVAYRELEEAVFSVRDVGGRESIIYQNPFFEKFFFASDQYRYHFRRMLAKLVDSGKITLEDGVPYYKGVALNTDEALRSEDKEVAFYARVVDGARPAVLFLDELDRNHAQMVRSLMTSFVFARSFQGGMTFYSTYLVAAWNRVHPEEEGTLGSFYLTAKTVSRDEGLDEGAFLARFEVIYLHPTDEEVYLPVIDHLVETFDGEEGKGNLTGVRKFLESLAKVKVPGPGGVSYSLLYYIPNLDSDDSSPEETSAKLLRGFATFRSYERLLTYLSNKKKRWEELPPAERTIYLPFVGSLLGQLFPTNPASVRLGGSDVKDRFASIFNNFIKENFGYEPFNPRTKEEKEATVPSTDRVLAESIYAGVPIALYGPPGLAKTSRVMGLIKKLNQKFFDKLRKDSNLRQKVVSSLSRMGLHVEDEDTESLISFLVTEVLVYQIGSEGATNPSTISGANVPLNLPDHPKVLEFSQAFKELSESLGLDSSITEHISLSFASSLVTGDETLVKRRVPNVRAVVLHGFLREFADAYGVLVFDEITRADFVTQGSFFDALSEGIIGGERFEPEVLSRIHMVATGNYNSEIFGTSVSEVDAALVARFANYFVMEPSDEDIDAYIEHLIRSIRETLPEGYDEDALEKLAEHLRGKEEDQDISSFRYLLKTLFTVEPRMGALAELKRELASMTEDVRVLSAAFPSPREISQLILNKFLPHWLPEFSNLGLAGDGGTRSERFLNALSGYYEGPMLSFMTEARGIDEAFVSPWLGEDVEPLLETLNPYAVAKAILSASSRSALVTYDHPYSNFVLIPEPTPNLFPNLSKELSRTSLAHLDFEPLSKQTATDLGILQVPLVLEVDGEEKPYATSLKDHPVYVARNIFSLKPMGEVDWQSLAKKSKALRSEIKNYIFLMMAVSSLVANQVYLGLVGFLKDLLEDRILFFPGLEISVSPREFSKLQRSRDKQKSAFVAHLLLILELYSRARTRAILGTEKAKGKALDGLMAEIYEDFTFVLERLKKKFGSSSLPQMLSKAEEVYGSLDMAYSGVSRAISNYLGELISKKFGVDLPTAISILQLYGRDESDSDTEVPQSIVNALEYLRTLLRTDTLARLLDSPVDEKTAPVLDYVTGNATKVVLMLNQDELEEIASNSEGEEEGRVFSYITDASSNAVSSLRSLGAFVSIDTAVPPASGNAESLSTENPLVPKVGILFPPSNSSPLSLPTSLLDLLSPEEAPTFSFPVEAVSFYSLVGGKPVFQSVLTRTPIIGYSATRRTEKAPPKSKEHSHSVYITTAVDITFLGGAVLSLQTRSRVDVSKDQAEELKEVLKSEEFAEARNQAEKDENYYLSSVLKDLEVLGGASDGYTLYATTSSRPNVGKNDVVVPPELVLDYVKSQNTALFANSQEDLAEASELARAVSERLLKAYSKGREAIAGVASTSTSSLSASSSEETLADEDIFAGEADFDSLFSSDGDFLGFGDEQEMKPTAPETKDVKKATKERGTYSTPVSSRTTMFFLSLLRRALDKSMRRVNTKIGG
jgi:MoxR-like ATPase